MLTQILFRKVLRDEVGVIKFSGGDKISEGFFLEAPSFDEAYKLITEKLKEFLKKKKVTVRTIKCSVPLKDLRYLYDRDTSGALCWEFN